VTVNTGQTSSVKVSLQQSEPVQSSITGVWRYYSSNFDDRYRFNTDGTYIESFYSFSSRRNTLFSGTWRSSGTNSYLCTTTTGSTFTIIYDPARKIIYDTRYPSLLYTRYQGDIMKQPVLMGTSQTITGTSGDEMAKLSLA